MLLTIGLIMIGWAIWLWKSSPVKYPERKAKYNLGGIKATLKATPDKPCKDFSDWGNHIFNARNGRRESIFSKYPTKEEMDILNKTYSRLRSDKPTRL